MTIPTYSPAISRPLFSLSIDFRQNTANFRQQKYARDFHPKLWAFPGTSDIRYLVDSNVYEHGQLFYSKIPGTLPDPLAGRLFMKPVFLVNSTQIEGGGIDIKILRAHISDMFVNKVLSFLSGYYNCEFPARTMGVREVSDDRVLQDAIINSNRAFAFIIVHFFHSNACKLFAISFVNDILLSQSVLCVTPK